MKAKGTGNLTFRQDFNANETVQNFGSNSLLLYALGLRHGIEELDEFASNALVDGGDDKKIDVCFIDEDDGVITLGQAYMAQIWGKEAAPANKATDLNGACAWLLSADVNAIPEKIKPKAQEVRQAIESGSISKIELIYVHNCFEHKNVESELATAAAGLRDILRARDPEGRITVSHFELGLNSIEELFTARDNNILVNDWIDLPNQEFIEESGSGWRGVALSISGDWIRDLFVRHGDKLFSANFRGYLGARKSKKNINSKIKQTASYEPDNFWVYNNGITAITRELDLNKTANTLSIRGISIINGAQTSGALGESSEEDALKTRVHLRIIEAKDDELINKAILFTNTQNEIKPYDQKSNDPIQKKLSEALSQYGLKYSHRRTQAKDPKGTLRSSLVGAALCAFHGDPQTAYRNPTEIFNNDDTYRKVFTGVSAEHVFLVHTLSTAIDRIKLRLKKRYSEDLATESERSQYHILQYTPSKHFLLYIIGVVAEQIYGQRISDKKFWQIKQANISDNNKRVLDAWNEVLEIILPGLVRIMDAEKIYSIERSFPESKKTADDFRLYFEPNVSLYIQKLKKIRSITKT